jgi:hypothetical protein
MLRKFLGTTAVATLVCVSVVLADDVKGKITKVDPDKKVITVTTDGKDTEYTVSADCKMPKQRMKGNKGGGGGGDAKDMTLKDLQAQVDRAKGGGRDVNATVTVEKKGGKEQVTEIKLERRGGGTDKPKPKDDPDKDKDKTNDR